VPDLSKPGAVFDDSLLAGEIASDGFAVLHFDADGRGRSRHGTEDYDGTVQQDGLQACALLLASKPYVDSENLGIYSRGYGIVMATGMVARNDQPQVKYLLDFEGPSDRYQCCADSGGHVPVSPDSDAFWQGREAGQFIKYVPGAYIRIQTATDHTNRIPDNHHCIALADSATSTIYGGAGISIWTRVNDSVMNPENTTYTLSEPPQYVREQEERNLVCRELLYLHELANRDFASAVTTCPLPAPRNPGLSLALSPNPFRSQALVEFTAPFSGMTELRTFSSDGRLVASQTREAVTGQRMSFRLDGAKLANGTYLVQVVTPAGVYAQKTVILK
jgi:hypothetical protein